METVERDVAFLKYYPNSRVSRDLKNQRGALNIKVGQFFYRKMLCWMIRCSDEINCQELNREQIEVPVM